MGWSRWKTTWGKTNNRASGMSDERRHLEPHTEKEKLRGIARWCDRHSTASDGIRWASFYSNIYV